MPMPSNATETLDQVRDCPVAMEDNGLLCARLAQHAIQSFERCHGSKALGLDYLLGIRMQ